MGRPTRSGFGETYTVCLVDDDPSVRRALRRLLTRAGFTVRDFSSAECFLAAGVDSERTCLVLDIRMPGMSGLQLLQALGDANHGFPVIFLTGYGTAADVAEATGSDAAIFLEKPVERETLLAAIERSLGLSPHSDT